MDNNKEEVWDIDIGAHAFYFFIGAVGGGGYDVENGFCDFVADGRVCSGLMDRNAVS